MWASLLKVIKLWWHQSPLSSWYVKKIIRRYNIDLTLYAIDPALPPTLAQFMVRKHRTKPRIPRSNERLILAPVAGTVLKYDAHHLIMQMNIQHYHRIHVPIAGTITHYTRAPYTNTIIHITAPDGFVVSLTIYTPAQHHATILHYNPQRNYHLQGTEIGCIYATEALITLQSSKPCVYEFQKNDEVSCIAPVGALTSAIRQQLTSGKLL